MDTKTAGRIVGLPANRAFVVQLAVSVGAETPIRGRIEHLASGSVTHFESLTQLGESSACSRRQRRAGRRRPPNDRKEDRHGPHER